MTAPLDTHEERRVDSIYAVYDAFLKRTKGGADSTAISAKLTEIFVLSLNAEEKARFGYERPLPRSF